MSIEYRFPEDEFLAKANKSIEKYASVFASATA